MDRRNLVIVVLIVVAIILPTLYVGSSIIASSSLEWGVEVGDEFTYHIFEEGWLLEGGGVSSNITPYTAVNDTNVVITILFLPDLGVYLTGDGFAKDVVQSIKVDVVFENGSSLPDDYWMIETTLSRCILPTRGWALIDGFYQDTSDLERQWNVYYAYQDDDVFVFGYHMFDIDLDVSYEAQVSHDTGLPIRAIYNRTHGVDYDHTIIFEQVHP